MKSSEEQDAVRKFLSQAGTKGGRSRARLYSRQQLREWAKMGGRPRKHALTLKAISIQQPWASLIAIGAKRLETRSWNTSYRGLIAIHASKGFPGWAREKCGRKPFSTALSRAGLEPADLPLGAVIAIGRLEDSITATEAKNLIKAGRFRSDELAFGDLTRGQHAFILSHVRMLSEPVPATGTLGIWNWTGPSRLRLPLRAEEMEAVTR
jgi:activating signal cointegrator 1